MTGSAYPGADVVVKCVSGASLLHMKTARGSMGQKKGAAAGPKRGLAGDGKRREVSLDTNAVERFAFREEPVL